MDVTAVEIEGKSNNKQDGLKHDNIDNKRIHDGPVWNKMGEIRTQAAEIKRQENTE
jgi:hypothetical protein